MPDTPEGLRQVGPPIHQGVLDLKDEVNRVDVDEVRRTEIPPIPKLRKSVEPLPSGEIPIIPMGTPFTVGGTEFFITFLDVGIVVPGQREYDALSMEEGPLVDVPVADFAFPVRRIRKGEFNQLIRDPHYAEDLIRRTTRDGGKILLDPGLGITTTHLTAAGEVDGAQPKVRTHPRFITTYLEPPPAQGTLL